MRMEGEGMGGRDVSLPASSPARQWETLGEEGGRRRKRALAVDASLLTCNHIKQIHLSDLYRFISRPDWRP